MFLKNSASGIPRAGVVILSHFHSAGLAKGGGLVDGRHACVEWVVHVPIGLDQQGGETEFASAGAVARHAGTGGGSRACGCRDVVGECMRNAGALCVE